jgi:hypothetical protein
VILRGGRVAAAFLASVSARVSLEDTPEARVQEAIQSRTSLLYIGGGHWRARLVWKLTGMEHLLGVCLENGDYTPVDRQIVEQGVALLEHLDWRPGG